MPLWCLSNSSTKRFVVTVGVEHVSYVLVRGRTSPRTSVVIIIIDNEHKRLSVPESVTNKQHKLPSTHAGIRMNARVRNTPHVHGLRIPRNARQPPLFRATFRTELEGFWASLKILYSAELYDSGRLAAARERPSSERQLSPLLLLFWSYISVFSVSFRAGTFPRV